MTVPLSGTEHVLRCGPYAARIASVGATLRTLQYDGVDLVVPFAANEVRPSLRGALLAPWPNRVADGEYEFEGAIHRLVRNEQETSTAAHGLVAWTDFRTVEKDAARVLLSGVIAPQPGYPWRVRIDVEFRLAVDGLVQEVTAVNESAAPAPVGLGGHPYLTAGRPSGCGIDELILTVEAGRVLLVSEDRMLPVDCVPVTAASASGLDFREPARIGATRINNAFTALARQDGSARVRLVGDDGAGVEIEWDARCPWVQIYTADHGMPGEFRNGVAVEPMTCPPDAFNSKCDLLVVPPGGAVGAGWRIRRIGAD